MRPVRGNNDTCPCPSSSCLYRSESEQPSIKQFIANASNKIDQLYLCKYLPLRERKLVRKLHKTRAIYNRIWDENSAHDDCICDLHHRVPCEGMDTYNYRHLRLCRPNGQKSKGAYYSSQGSKSRHRGKSLSMSTIKKKRQAPQKFRSVPCSCDFECYKSVEELVCGRPDRGHLKQKSEKQKIKVKSKTQVLPSKSTETQKSITKKIKKTKEPQFNIRKDSLEKFREKKMKDKGTRPTRSSPELGQQYSESKNRAIQSERDSKSSKKTSTSYKKIRKDTEKLQRKQSKTVSALALKRCFCTVALTKNKKDRKIKKVATASQQNSVDLQRCFCTLNLKPKNDYIASEPFDTKLRQDKENMKVQTSLQNLKYKKYPSHSTVTKSTSLLSHHKMQTPKDELSVRLPRRVPARSRLLPEEINDKTQTKDVNFSTPTKVNPTIIRSQRDIPSPRASDSFTGKRSHECLRIESSFCFDIGLYKNRPKFENEPPSYFMADVSTNNKLTKTTLRRCFCTLRLNQNKDNMAMNELPDESTGKPRKVYTVNHAMVPGTLQYSKDMSLKTKTFRHRTIQSTEKLDGSKSTSLICVSENNLISNFESNRGTNFYTNRNYPKKVFYMFQEPLFNRDKHFCTMFSTAHKLEPYECEPGVCIPGKCDPHVCYKRIMQRGGIQYQHVPSKDRKNAVRVDSKVKMNISKKHNKREKTVSRRSTGVSRIKQKSQTKHAQFDETVTEKGSGTPPRFNKNKEKTTVVNTSRSTLTSKRLRGPDTSDTSEASTQSASRKPKTKTRTVSHEKKSKPVSRGDETVTQRVSRVERPINKPPPRMVQTNVQRIRSHSQPSDMSDASQRQSLINLHSTFNLCISFSKDGLTEAGDGVPRRLMPPCASNARPCNRNICPFIDDCNTMPPYASSPRPYRQNIRPREDDLRLRTAGVSTNLPGKLDNREIQTSRGQRNKRTESEFKSRTVQHTTDDKITIKVSKKQKQKLPPNKNIGRETKQIPEIRDEAISADFKTDNTTNTKKGFKPTKIIEPAENRDNATMTKRGYKPTKIIEPLEERREKRSVSYSEPVSTSRVARDIRPPPSRVVQRRDFVPPRRIAYDQGYESSETERRSSPIIRLSSCFSLNIEINKPGAKYGERTYEERPVSRYEEPRFRRDQQLSSRRRYEERPMRRVEQSPSIYEERLPKKKNKERLSKSTAKKDEIQQERGTGKPPKLKANKGVSHKGSRDLKLQTQDTGSKKSGNDSVLQRCFCTKNLKKNFVERCLCTLKFQKNTEKFRADDNDCKYQCCNAKTMTKPYNSNYDGANAKTMTACNPEYGNAKTMTGSDINPCKDACVGAKNRSKSKKKLRNEKLLPYECEPGICTPGKCDPYKCYERIQQRNVVGTYYAHTYDNKLSRKFTPKLFSRFFNDSSRNQCDKIPISNKNIYINKRDYPIRIDQAPCCRPHREVLKNRHKLVKNYDNDLARNNKIVCNY